MLTDYNSALRLVLKYSGGIGTEVVNIEDSLGLFLAKDLSAISDLPRFTSSAVDSYGVKIADLINANDENPAALKLVGEIKAGDSSKIKIHRGECLRILTGAPIPSGIDAVVMKEFTKKEGITIFFYTSPKLGDNFRYKGEEFRKGKMILPKYTQISPSVVGLLTSLGIKKIRVFKKPRVAVLVTGNELVEIGKKLKFGQIYDSNFYTLSSSLRQMDIDAINLGIAKDNKAELLKKIRLGLKKSDLLLVSGGISVGEYDYVQGIFDKLKIKKIFWRIAIKPGKPTYFGVKGKKLIFGLPGNPVASLLIFNQIVKPAIRKMMGENKHQPIILCAKLDEELKKRSGRLELVRGLLTANSRNEIVVTPTKGQGSHMLSGMADANCLIHFPVEALILKKGSNVKVELMK
ncbi:MAG: molybdopterin molybdotransferase MoeA [Ignavibacteriales bacterium]|nr:molybdopterin molybdotransferase MoeA [Ignavibacteriales bacterium]